MKRPYVILSWAQSSDGFIARSNGDSRFSPETDLIEVHKLRANVDGIIVGVGTVLKDNPHLTVRKIPQHGVKNPKRIILDSLLRTPIDSNILDDQAETIIFCNERLTQSGKIPSTPNIKIISVGNPKWSLSLILEKLSEMGIQKLMVEGGGQILASFLKDNLADEIRVCINPEICGSGVAINGYCVTDGKFESWKIVEKSKIEDCQILNLQRS
ncbi:MAG: dihydrofolate reductase family protein [bacterium]|nr:dihydrofolate reductase family protein [bacterium]